MAGYIGPSPPNRILSSADIADNSITGAKIVAGTIEASDVAADMATQAELDLKANIASPTFTGTIGGGTLGSAVVFDDAHKDIDMDADGWDFLMSGVVDYSTDAIIDYPWEIKKGSNITEAAGVMTVAKAGWYFVTATAGQWAQNTTQINVQLRTSDPDGSAGNTSYVTQPGRILVVSPDAGESYGVSAMSWLVYLRATDKCHMYGTGHLYGNTTSDGTVGSATNRFLGVRLGA